jgi:bifunctional non-homologous end joining protein LigD
VAFQYRKPADIGVKAPLPALATGIEKVPSGDRWIHEIKFDGYRVQVHLANETAKIFTRRGHDWTHRFKKVAHDAWRIKASSAVIDGEIVVPAADGTTDFSVLQNELKGPSKKIVLVAFDLLYLNGRDLRKLPLHHRKSELKKVVAGTDIQFSESFEIDGGAMFEHACKLSLEGVVSKIRDGAYPKGRTNDWMKKTCAQRETLTIAGFAFDGSKWDGLYVGRRKGDDLVYAGKVDHGFDKASRRSAEAPGAAGPKDAGLREAHLAQGHLGRTEAVGRDRVPGEVRRGKGPAPLLQRVARGPLMLGAAALR